jgi:hypothetical protein
MVGVDMPAEPDVVGELLYFVSVIDSHKLIQEDIGLFFLVCKWLPQSRALLLTLSLSKGQ